MFFSVGLEKQPRLLKSDQVSGDTAVAGYRTASIGAGVPATRHWWFPSSQCHSRQKHLVRKYSVVTLLSSSLVCVTKPKAQFPFKRNRFRCVRCVNENRKKRKRLRYQAANHGCHCFDRAFLLAGACVCCVKFSRNKRNARNSQAIAFEWKPRLKLSDCN